MPKLMIVIASTRPGRVGLPVAEWFRDRAAEHGGFEVGMVDFAELELPLLDEASHPRLRQYTKQHTHDWSAMVEDADAFVFVTSEYNHGYPASLKNAMDYVFPEFNKKPMTFVGYGNAGGARAIEQLRLVSVEFEMAPLRRAVHIFPDVMRPAMTSEEFTPALFESLDARLEMMIEELVWWATALKNARDN